MQAPKLLILFSMMLILEGCIAHALGYALGTAQVMAEDTVSRTVGAVIPRE